MTGGIARHSIIGRNWQTALHTRLRGGRCSSLGPDAGVETGNSAVRYPDALVTCSTFDITDRTICGVVVFEVVSLTSGRIDRIVKVREYAAVPSIRRYIILESNSVGLTVLEWAAPDEPWRASTLTKGDTIRLPEIDLEIPVTEFYEDIAFPEDGEASAG